MKNSWFHRYVPFAVCMAFAVPAMTAQNSIQLFGPVDVRASVSGTTYDDPIRSIA